MTSTASHTSGSDCNQALRFAAQQQQFANNVGLGFQPQQLAIMENSRLLAQKGSKLVTSITPFEKLMSTTYPLPYYSMNAAEIIDRKVSSSSMNMIGNTPDGNQVPSQQMVNNQQDTIESDSKVTKGNNGDTQSLLKSTSEMQDQKIIQDPSNLAHRIKQIPDFSHELFDFFQASKIITQIQQIMTQQKQIQEKKASGAQDNEQYMMSSFMISSELDLKEVYIKKIIPDELCSFRIFAEFFTFSQSRLTAEQVKYNYIQYISTYPNQFSKMIEMLCPQVSCFEEYYDMVLSKGSVNFEVEIVILSIMFQVSLQVLFVDPLSLTLKSFNLDMPILTTDVNRMCLSAMESATSGTFDVCYLTKYIEKTAFIQKVLKSIVEDAIGGMISNSSERPTMRPTAFKQLYTNHEYLNWLQQSKALKNQQLISQSRGLHQMVADHSMNHMGQQQREQVSVLEQQQQHHLQMNPYYNNPNSVIKEEPGEEESKQFMLPYSNHYVNPQSLTNLGGYAGAEPQNARKNDSIEEEEEEFIFKEEYISNKDGLGGTDSSSSQGKLESFPNQSEGQSESIFHKNPFQDDNFNKDQQKSDHTTSQKFFKVKHRLSSSHDFLPQLHTDSILPTMVDNNKKQPLDKQSTHTQNNQQLQMKFGQSIHSQMHNSEFSKGKQKVQIPNQIIDCQSSHNGSEASYNTQPTKKVHQTQQPNITQQMQQMNISMPNYNALQPQVHQVFGDQQYTGQDPQHQLLMSLQNNLIPKNFHPQQQQQPYVPSQSMMVGPGGIPQIYHQIQYNQQAYPGSVSSNQYQNSQQSTKSLNNHHHQSPANAALDNQSTSSSQQQQRSIMQTNQNQYQMIAGGAGNQYAQYTDSAQMFQRPGGAPNPTNGMTQGINQQIMGGGNNPQLINIPQQYNPNSQPQISQQPMGQMITSGMSVSSQKSYNEISQHQQQNIGGNFRGNNGNPTTDSVNGPNPNYHIGMMGMPLSQQNSFNKGHPGQIMMNNQNHQQPMHPSQSSVNGIQGMPQQQITPSVFIPTQTLNSPQATEYVMNQMNSQFPQYQMKNGAYPKHIIGQIQNLSQRQTGRLKFFDEGTNFGFIIMDSDGSDLFVHYDDLVKATLTKDILLRSKYNYTFFFSFIIMTYYGKHNLSRKAVDLQLLMIQPPQPTSTATPGAPQLPPELSDQHF